MSAGGTSATVEALRCQLRIEEYERLLAAERDRLRRFRLAGTAERRVAARLAPTSAWGWTLLADRRWPRTRAANVDLIHVGPAGVLVADVKAWAEPAVLDGRVHNGPEDMTGAVDALLAVPAWWRTRSPTSAWPRCRSCRCSCSPATGRTCRRGSGACGC